jgi:TldD protein
MDRRTFLQAAAVLSAGAAQAAPEKKPAPARAGPPPPRPFSEKEQARRAAQRALEVARSLGASYADVRLLRLRGQRIRVSGDDLHEIQDDERYGAGVRVHVGGGTGFVAAQRVSEADLQRAAEEAVRLAQAARKASGVPIALPQRLAPTGPAPQTRWVAPFQLDPFVLPLSLKIQTLREATLSARDIKAAGVKLTARAELRLLREEKAIYTSEGLLVEQLAIRSAPWLHVTALDLARGDVVERDSSGEFPARTLGWEHIKRDRFIEIGARLAEDAVRQLRAQDVAAGTYDLILAPSHLDQVLRRTIAEAALLSRVLAGESFLTPPNRGRLQLAAPIVTVVADRTQPEGLMTASYDDDGDAAVRFAVVQDGRFVSFLSTRHLAAQVQGGLGATGRGCAYGGSFAAPPELHLPNVSLLPGPDGPSLEALIADTRRAIYIEGRGPLSADPSRRRFTATSGSAWLIEDGKRKMPLRRVAYSADTLAFWRACDRLCGEAEYRLGSVIEEGDEGFDVGFFSGASHGCPPARFKAQSVQPVRAPAPPRRPA